MSDIPESTHDIKWLDFAIGTVIGAFVGSLIGVFGYFVFLKIGWPAGLIHGVWKDFEYVRWALNAAGLGAACGGGVYAEIRYSMILIEEYCQKTGLYGVITSAIWIVPMVTFSIVAAGTAAFQTEDYLPAVTNLHFVAAAIGGLVGLIFGAVVWLALWLLCWCMRFRVRARSS